MKNFRTKSQLKKAGASSSELDTLTLLSNRLSNLDKPKLDKSTKKAIASSIGFKQSFLVQHRSSFSAAGAFLLLLISLTVFAQSAQPGDILYALKRGSEEVRKVVQPGFDDSDIQKARDDENKSLNDDSRSESDDDNSRGSNSGSGSRKSGSDDSGDHNDDRSGSNSGSDDDQKDDDQKIESSEDRSGSNSGSESSGGSSDDNDDSDKDDDKVLGESTNSGSNSGSGSRSDNSGSGSNKSGSNSGSNKDNDDD